MILRRIIGILCVPVALFTLISGVSFISKDKQETIEKNLEEDTAKPFEPVFRFAITSDVHISAADNTNTERLKKMFETAYRYSDSHPSYKSLDAVLLAGDNCDSGSDEEYEILTSTVKESIREGTEFITIMGNHEFAKTGHEGYVRHMGEELDKHVVVKGFHFIGISPDPTDTWHTPLQINWMSRELRKAEQADPDKPIFTMQHGHIWNTVYVSRSWYTQMSIPLHMVYSQYPQVINFSGHSHGPVNNPLEIWQNNYTQLGTGTLNYFEMERDISDNTVPEGSRNAAQYLIVEVDAQNRVRIQPFNMLTDDFFRTPSNTDSPNKQLIYQINDVFDTSNYAYTSARKKTAGVPEFDKDAAVKVEKEDGNAKVTFPQAKDDICVYGYRISLFDKSSPKKAAAEKEIYSGYYFEPMPETLSHTFENIEKGKTYTVKVTPLNVWLQEGKPLECEFTS
ncbi:MAG: metallophosphoesterase [Clostridia bacterium]|nr:metallophosphoesterase [Clostridia bacterium]